MVRVGVLGVGRMGAPIARRLVASGHEVLVFDVDPAACAAVAGATLAADALALAAVVDVLVTVLPGPAELREAMLGAAGAPAAAETPGGGAAVAAADVAAGAVAVMRPGSIWLDLTSNDPRVATEVAAAARLAGIASVGAPMRGGPADAAAGTLGFYVGGEGAAVDRVEPVLALFGPAERRIRMHDDIASGYATKLLANTLWFGQAILVTEMLLVGQTLGLSAAALRQALAASPGGSVFLADHAPALLKGDYLTTFGLDRVVEELASVEALANAGGVPAEATALIARLHREALQHFGAVDGELLGAALIEHRAGRTVRG